MLLLIRPVFYDISSGQGNAILGTAFGVFIGRHGVNVFNPRSWGNQQDGITLTVMRLILVSGLFAAGIELPCAYMKNTQGVYLSWLCLPWRLAGSWLQGFLVHSFPSYILARHSVLLLALLQGTQLLALPSLAESLPKGMFHTCINRRGRCK